ncbi:MAG: AAA family ATPase, partial [Deltaproteobacteria bacterium]|nr:AAA family ATPase [Deltaproteobacteria bacterium]
MMTLKELPLGNQTFAKIREGNILYVDKTEYIYKLIKSSKRNYFLSRPRRFGKTLLLNTLEELFSGNRESFKGLFIDRSDYDFPKLPVISLSLSLEAFTPEL